MQANASLLFAILGYHENVDEIRYFGQAYQKNCLNVKG